MNISRCFKTLIVACILLSGAGLSTLTAQDESGFLAGLTEAVAADPENAETIVSDALQSRLADISNTPSLATSIIFAVLAGIPENMLTADVVAGILDASVGVLKTLPADKSSVASDAVKAVVASLPPGLAQAVQNLVLTGPQGGFRDELTAIFTTFPRGGEDSTRVPSPDSSEDENPDEEEVTPMVG